MTQFRLAVLSVIVVFAFWGCGLLSPLAPSADPPPENTPINDPPIIPEALPKADIIAETNNRRIANGFNLLVENQKLNAAADYKMRDMFARQYFDHYGPGQTSGVVELLQRFGYGYTLVGENLAMGNFRNANELLSLWMGSPGHRANILRADFKEIGVATGYGIFNGKRTIIAVQIFGTRG